MMNQNAQNIIENAATTEVSTTPAIVNVENTTPATNNSEAGGLEPDNETIPAETFNKFTGVELAQLCDKRSLEHNPKLTKKGIIALLMGDNTLTLDDVNAHWNECKKARKDRQNKALANNDNEPATKDNAPAPQTEDNDTFITAGKTYKIADFELTTPVLCYKQDILKEEVQTEELKSIATVLCRECDLDVTDKNLKDFNEQITEYEKTIGYTPNEENIKELFGVQYEEYNLLKQKRHYLIHNREINGWNMARFNDLPKIDQMLIYAIAIPSNSSYFAKKIVATEINPDIHKNLDKYFEIAKEFYDNNNSDESASISKMVKQIECDLKVTRLENTQFFNNFRVRDNRTGAKHFLAQFVGKAKVLENNVFDYETFYTSSKKAQKLLKTRLSIHLAILICNKTELVYAVDALQNENK